jgi:hypothetical protein
MWAGAPTPHRFDGTTREENIPSAIQLAHCLRKTLSSCATNSSYGDARILAENVRGQPTIGAISAASLRI